VNIDRFFDSGVKAWVDQRSTTDKWNFENEKNS
jgi:hypothetical protein